MLHVTCYMKIIVGLGNPGEKYSKNRHNIGFMFLDFLLKEYVSRYTVHDTRFIYDKYLLSDIITLHDTRYTTNEIILVKPHTFMNRSGDAVAACVTRYTLHDLRNELVVVHDDLDIPFGKFKIQLQGPKAHNGLTDIQNKLQTMDFLRIRIGVDNRQPENRMNGEEYVLQNFTNEEFLQLPELFKNIDMRFKAFL